MQKSLAAEIKEWVVSIAIAAVIAFILQTFVIQPHEVFGPSMLPTLSEGQRVLVNKFIYRFHPPQRGDIIVLWYQRTDRNYIKRVIAVAGDSLEIKNGTVFLNGQQLNEPYIFEPTGGVYKKATVPEDHVFVMGDNRNDSDDSRFTVGFLPLELIKGRAEAVIWPLKAMKIIKHAGI